MYCLFVVACIVCVVCIVCCCMYCLFCVVLCIVCAHVFTVLLPPGGYPIAVKYISYHIIYHINDLKFVKNLYCIKKLIELKVLKVYLKSRVASDFSWLRSGMFTGVLPI